MEIIEQQRAAALARIAVRKAAAAQEAVHAKKLKGMRDAGQFQALLVMAGMSLVRHGGNGLRNLREDVYDAAHNTNGRAGMTSIEAVYDTAMMGGEPYAVWN